MKGIFFLFVIFISINCEKLLNEEKFRYNQIFIHVINGFKYFFLIKFKKIIYKISKYG